MLGIRMINNIINENPSNKFIIVGAGKRGKEVKDCLEGENIRVLYFFDNDPIKNNTTIDGVQVVLPYKHEEECSYIIAVDDSQVCESLRRQLIQLGIGEKQISICNRDTEYQYWSSLAEDKYMEEISYLYYDVFGRDIRWSCPTTYNEIINWEKLFAKDIEIKTLLSDKYKVRKWVEDRVGNEHLVKCLGVWNDPEDIDFDSLPSRFVLKMTNASGRNILVKDKSKVNYSDIKRTLNLWIGKNYGYEALALHYKNIIPRIICEEYLDGLAEESYDYDVFCFHGEPKYICCIKGSHRKRSLSAYYDLDWNRQDFEYGWPGGLEDVPKPRQLEMILEFSRILSKSFRHVRVDWYIMNDGRVLFSEMTFATWGGLKRFIPEEWDERFGKLIIGEE